MAFILSKQQRDLLLTLSEDISSEEVLKNYSLSTYDKEIINSHRGNSNKFGFALQLCLIRHKGRAFSSYDFIPKKILLFLEEQLKIPKEGLANYTKETTIFNHYKEIRDIYGFQIYSGKLDKEIKHSLEREVFRSNDGLFLISHLLLQFKLKKIIIPGITVIEDLVSKMILDSETKAIKELNKFIDQEQKMKMDKLISFNEKEVDNNITWLREFTGKSTPDEFLNIMKKIKKIESLKLKIKIDKVPSYIIEQYIKLGKRYDPYSLRRFSAEKRYALVSVFLMELLQILIDRVITIHDVKMTSVFSSIRKKQEESVKTQKKIIKSTVEDYIFLGNLIIEARENKEDLNYMIEKNIDSGYLLKSLENAKNLSNKTHNDSLNFINNYYNSFRRYSPTLLNSLRYTSINEPCKNLITAIEVIKDLNKTKKVNLPDDIDISFTNKKWQVIINKKEGAEKRHYFELAVLNELRNKIRAGDISVSGSKSYKNFEEYLIPKEQWEIEKSNTRLSAPLSIDEYFKEAEKRLKPLLKWYSENYETLDEIIGEDNKLHPKLVEKTTPEESKALSKELYKLVPKIGLQNLLLEVSNITEFQKYFSNLTNDKTIESKEDLIALIFSIMGIGTNVGLSKISESLTNISYKQLAYTSDWRILESNLYNAISTIVDCQLKEPITKWWGDGTTSSSDGMRVKSGAKSLNSSHNPHFGSEKGFTIYRFVNDKYSAFYSTITNPSARDAIHVIDGLLKYSAETKIKEHYTDTAGYTDQVFALMSIMGFTFAPRLRNLPDLKLYSFDKNEFPKLKNLITGTTNKDLIKENYDTILRLSHSIFEGKVSSALILTKLGSYARNNSVANALKEMGRIEKTIFILKYASDPKFRKRIQIGLNKGEEMHGMARSVFFGKKGYFWEHELQKQLQKSSCLNLILNSIVLWNTKYLSKAWSYYKEKHPDADEELLKHISPLNWEHINFLGKYSLDFEFEHEEDSLRKLNI